MVSFNKGRYTRVIIALVALETNDVENVLGALRAGGFLENSLKNIGGTRCPSSQCPRTILLSTAVQYYCTRFEFKNKKMK